MNKIKIGFFKKEQGIFDSQLITTLKNQILEKFNCELVEVDFREGIIVNDRVFVGDLCLNDLDVYFWHDSVFPSIWGADNYYCHILDVLEKDVAIINTGLSVRTTNDKYLAHQALKKSNLPVGEFSLVRSDDTVGLRKIFELFNEDVLLKPRFGGWGIGIVRVKKIDELMSSVEFMNGFTKHPQQILIEKFHKNDLSKWISVVVFGDKVLFGYKKPLFTDGVDWKIYDPFKQDGRGQKTIYVEVPEELQSIALQAKNAIGKDIICFDFIYTSEGYKIIDENGRPGLYKHCLESANINIIDEIITLIESKIT